MSGTQVLERMETHTQFLARAKLEMEERTVILNAATIICLSPYGYRKVHLVMDGSRSESSH